MSSTANIYKPDSILSDDFIKWDDPSHKNKLFLAGTIEQGTSIDWQQEVINQFYNTPDLAIFSPRRSNWDATLEQNMTCEVFRYQVVWEQKYLDECNLVLMYLVPGTYSPISLLELGQLSKHHKKEVGEDKHTVVVCPRSFWRRGYVEVVCSLFHLPLYETLEEGIAHIKTLIQIN